MTTIVYIRSHRSNRCRRQAASPARTGAGRAGDRLAAQFVDQVGITRIDGIHAGFILLSLQFQRQ